MRFSKYHGTGNDFILVEDMQDRVQWSPGTIAAACDRRFGIGADGVIRIAPAHDADFFMDYANADGQTAEMCGNGIRCLGKYVFDRGLTTSRELLVTTRAGLKHLVLHVDDGLVEAVSVDMGHPALTRGGIPMAGDPDSTFVGQPIEVDGRTIRGTAVSMGNPHVVLFLDPSDRLAQFPVRVLGPLVEERAEFPQRTNVEFVTVQDGRILARVWERGSGETMACGTGGCAAMVASSLEGLVGREAEVEFPGGALRVAWREDDSVELTGPAVCVFDGELDPDWLRASAEAALR